MAFKAKATQRDDGNYDLSYGKGSKKITGLLVKDGTKWRVHGEAGPAKLKREVLEDWGKSAADAYGGSSAGTSVTTPRPSTTAPPTYAPPSAPRIPRFAGEPGVGERSPADVQSEEFWLSPDASERAFFKHLSTLDRPLNPSEIVKAARILEGLIQAMTKPNVSAVLTPPKKGPPLYRPPTTVEIETNESEHDAGSTGEGESSDGPEGLAGGEGSEPGEDASDTLDAGAGEVEAGDGEGDDVSTEEGAG